MSEVESKSQLHGLLAEYDSPGKILQAAEQVRKAGLQHWDTFTPFPVHGIEKAMGIQPTRLPYLVMVAGTVGFTVAVLLQWWTNAVNYPWIVSGKPFWSIPANVPIMFELTVLFAAITTLVGMLVMNNLPFHSHPLDLVKRFARVTDDKFFLLIEARDPKFNEAKMRALLERTHPAVIESVPEDTSPAELPRVIYYVGGVLAVVAVIPLVLITAYREMKRRETRIHLVQDMDFQKKYKAQSENTFFADARAMRDPVVGTIADGDLQEDDVFYRGKEEDQWIRRFPAEVEVSDATMARGKQRFGIYCAPCHGQAGEGNGMVAQRAAELEMDTWVAPTNLNQDYLREQPIGQLFNSITNGVRNMPAYGPQIPVSDRWAILLYVRALQNRAVTPVGDLNPDERNQLK